MTLAPIHLRGPAAMRAGWRLLRDPITAMQQNHAEFGRLIVARRQRIDLGLVPGEAQQLLVRAFWSDKTIEDVTTTAQFDALKGPFDFVLVDLWKEHYVDAFDLFYPKLSPGALIVADNMILPENYREDALRYRKHVRSKPKIDSVLIPVGSGVELSRYADPLKP